MLTYVHIDANIDGATGGDPKVVVRAKESQFNWIFMNPKFNVVPASNILVFYFSCDSA